MAEAAETQPLNKEVSLRFPEGSVGSVGSVGPETKPTEGMFDGNTSKAEPWGSITRRKDYGLPIPKPPQKDIDDAIRGGKDSHGYTKQCEWESVVVKRQAPYILIRVLTLNCFCTPNWTLTRAQWLWFVNILCLGLHVYYLVLIWDTTLGKGEQFEATVWRIKPVWNATAVDGHTAILVDNLMPIRVDLVLGFVFLGSSIKHGLLVALGPFDRWLWLYWRQVDLCFHYWRWAEFAITLPLTMMVICCIIHLREQNAIASVFMLMFSSIAGFFLTELWSRPHRNQDGSYNMFRWMGDDAPVERFKTWMDLTAEQKCERAYQKSRRRMNYVVRMFPHVLGIFPFVAMWVIVLNHFFFFLEDTRLKNTDDIYQRVPDFVPMIVLGSLVFCLLGFFPLWWWQWAEPQHYWKTEIVYPFLQLGGKYYVWYLMNQNVFTFEGGLGPALALDQGVNMTAL